MDAAQLSAVVDRLQHDTSFRSQYCSDPDSALSAFSLTPDEVHALKTGDGLPAERVGCGQQWDSFVRTLCGPDPGD